MISTGNSTQMTSYGKDKTAGDLTGTALLAATATAAITTTKLADYAAIMPKFTLELCKSRVD
jgi:hypothetical protein